MSAPLPNRKPSANAGAAYSPRRAVRQTQTARNALPIGQLRAILLWVRQRFSEHFAGSLIALAFALGGLLMLVYFYRIQYLPNISLESATGTLLGLAMAGTLTLGSLAFLLGLPGAALQLCLRYRVINPGAEKLDKKETNSARQNFRGNARVSFLLHVYVAEFLALLTILGPAYLNLTHTIFGWSLVATTWAISCIFLVGVALLVIRYEKGGPVERLARVRYRKVRGHTHGLWILGFLTLLLICISTFLFQLFPLFQRGSDFDSLLNYWLVISISCGVGIIAIHNWKSTLFFGVLPLILFLFALDGFGTMSESVIRTLKLGALENTTMLVTPTGCQSIAAHMTTSLCAKQKPLPPDATCRIHGLTILSRIGEEQLLAFKDESSETRLTLRSSEVISMAYPEKRAGNSAPSQARKPCVTIEPTTPPPSSEK